MAGVCLTRPLRSAIIASEPLTETFRGTLTPAISSCLLIELQSTKQKYIFNLILYFILTPPHDNDQACLQATVKKVEEGTANNLKA